MLPGLKRAIPLFGAYVLFDLAYSKFAGSGHDDHGHHADHGEAEDEASYEWQKELGGKPRRVKAE